MAPFPDFGMWLMRSVRRDSDLDSPVSVIERLNALPRPLRNAADKDTLVGAVLSLGPSLQLALHILLELLPEDESRERLGEVLCPTLGQLQRSLTDTLLSLRGPQDDKTKKSFAANRAKHMRIRSNTLPLPSEILFRGVRIGDRGMKSASPGPALSHVAESPVTPATYPNPDPIDDDFLTEPALLLSQLEPTPPPLQREPASAPIGKPPPPRPRTAETFPPLDAVASPGPRDPSPAPQERRPDPAADLALVKELRAEMRVNAAIQVAVDSLEFAEGQLKIVKNVHRLHGGSFQLLEKHFYQGYNRILFRALELERREFDSPSGSDYCPSPRLVCDDMGDLMVEPRMKAASVVAESVVAEPVPAREGAPQRSISFQDGEAAAGGAKAVVPVLQLEPPSPPKGPGPVPEAARAPASPVKKLAAPAVLTGPGAGLVRRNTAQGLTGQSARQARARPPAKRRLSLAEELALAGDSTTSEDESGEEEDEEEEEDDENDDNDDDDDDDETQSTRPDPARTENKPNPEADDDSSSDSDGPRNNAPRKTRPGPEASDSDDSSSSDDNDERDPDSDGRSTQSSMAPTPTFQPAVMKGVVTRGGTKRLQTALLVSSPPTSPERQADF